MSGHAGPAMSLAPHFRDDEVSFWFADAGPPQRRAALPGPRDYDVVVVGGGYTGLWSAYYLKKAQPDLRIAVLEREVAGYGASGRNGGWLSAEFAGARERLAEARGRKGVIDLQRALFGTIDEVIRVAAAEGIDADIVKSGHLRAATNPAQRVRLREGIRQARGWGVGPDDEWLLTRDEWEPRLRIAGALDVAFTPHCARVQPAKLAFGLASAVERLGVDVFEGTTVTEIRPGAAVTDRGEVRAEYVLRATEAFTGSIKGYRRLMLPMHASMIVTAPLDASAWQRIGWQGKELLSDESHAYLYVQRTAGDRIALGGRGGLPYRFGSRIDADGHTGPRTAQAIWRLLVRLLPDVADVPVARAWTGVLGVPRDWCASVHVDHRSGLGWAGGYVGSGVANSNLAARALRDLVLRADTDLTGLPWVGRRPARWAPEPLRWLGMRLSHARHAAADRRETAHARSRYGG